ncbi:MAG: Si-specific NAD(P)(+) transhydrogenase [Verrucomicrobia bacterium]|nr:Si-specific NAD(P)(+) transhydrogenase [Verrucomicrobiota bacterium]
MDKMKVDMLVVGSGAAGQKAAIQGAKLGKQVAIAEQEYHPGGACLNTGTIPSKSLREAILDLTRFQRQSFYGNQIDTRKVSIHDLNFRLNQVLEEQRRVLLRQFRKNRIRLLPGVAQFITPHEMQVGESLRVTADYIVIATGSLPRNPTAVPFDGEVILDSSSLLAIDQVPESLLVLGGGVIGSEYASFFATLGTKTTVIDQRSHMLAHLDAEIGIHLQTGLMNIGLEFYGGRHVERIERLGRRAKVYLADGGIVEADKLLYALGRVANVQGLGLDQIGLALTPRGHLEVNSFFQTALPHIYAVGDVIPGPALASIAMEQGRCAARHAFGMPMHERASLYPLGIYTIPEISCIGSTEQELVQQGISFEVGRAYFYEIARANISGNQNGCFKLLFDKETLKLLGVHIIGSSASELIHIGQLAMIFGATIDTFIHQVFNYPTLAEGYRIAALNGMNKLERLQS